MAGFKDFSVGEVLTAADVDDYLANGPHVHLARGSTQSISNNTSTDISWTSETSDRSALSSGTVTSITIPAGQGGVWVVMVGARFASNGTGIRILEARHNGTAVTQDRRDAMATGSQPHDMYAGYIKLLAVSDTISATVFQSSGGSLNIESGCVLMISRIST